MTDELSLARFKTQDLNEADGTGIETEKECKDFDLNDNSTESRNCRNSVVLDQDSSLLTDKIDVYNKLEQNIKDGIQSEVSNTNNKNTEYVNGIHEPKCNEEVQDLKQKCVQLEKIRNEYENKLDKFKKQRDAAVKEKENMVIKYAVGEKKVIEERQLKEQTDKKYKEVIKENEILQYKLQTMISEKSRICQMLDNKCYEHKTLQQEFDRTKSDLAALENKLKWSQNGLKNEIEVHKESQKTIELLNRKLLEATDQIEQTKKDANESVKTFHNSQENRAHVLDVQVKEQQASLILLRHERDDREQQIDSLRCELERLQTKQKEMLQENNELSMKVQHLEKDRVHMQHKLSELRGCADQQKQDVADLQIKNTHLEQLQLQLRTAQEQLKACDEQVNFLKSRNGDLESDMEISRAREAELLVFTQQLTDKNVRLQSEFTSMETKVQQLVCEHALLKRAAKEQETKASMSLMQLTDERVRYVEDIDSLKKSLAETETVNKKLKQETVDQKGENSVIKRKLELSLREVQRELQQCRKRLEQIESTGVSRSSSSSSSLNGGEKSLETCDEQVKVIQPDTLIDRQALIERIVKLQKISAKKSEKLDFLEEHVLTLITEIQKKSKLLQSYVLREQAGTLSSNKMDNNKANLAKLNGVMASMYSSRILDDQLTLELSLEINRKLQAVLEDALLKNITLKENVDTLGLEIDRLHKLLKP